MKNLLLVILITFSYCSLTEEKQKNNTALKLASNEEIKEVLMKIYMNPQLVINFFKKLGIYDLLIDYLKKYGRPSCKNSWNDDNIITKGLPYNVCTAIWDILENSMKE